MAGVNLQLTVLELARLGRQGRTYAYQTLGLAVVAAALVFVPMTAEAASSALAALAHFLQFWGAFLLGPALTVSPLFREKEERTLELLMLADHTGWDVTLSKFAPPFFGAGLVVLSTLPLLSFASFLGGINVAEEAACVAVSLSWCGASCALALYAACKAGSRSGGLLMAYSLLAAALLVAVLLDWITASPSLYRPSYLALNLDSVDLVEERADLWRWIWTAYLARSIIALFLVVAGLVAAARCIRNGAGKIGEGSRRSRHSRTRRRDAPSEDLGRRAGSVLARTGTARGWTAGLPVAAFAVAALPFSILLCTGWTFPLAFAVTSCRARVGAWKESAVFDDLALTRLTDSELRAALEHNLFKTVLPFGPALIVASYIIWMASALGGHHSGFLETVFAAPLALLPLTYAQLRFALGIACNGLHRKPGFAFHGVRAGLALAFVHAPIFLVGTFVVAVLGPVLSLGALLIGSAFYIGASEKMMESWKAVPAPLDGLMGEPER